MPASRAARAAVAIALALWTVRAAALPVRLEMQAARVRQEWQDVEGWLERQHIAVATPEARALVTRLRRSALRTRPQHDRVDRMAVDPRPELIRQRPG